MSNRNTFGAVVLAALVGGAVLFVVHNRKEVSRASTTPPISSSDPATAAPPVSAVPQPEPSSSVVESPRQPTNINKPPATPAMSSPIRPGKMWLYSASVSKLNAVANLELKVYSQNFLGKEAWHLQAFAHTENPLRMVFALDDRFDSYSDAVTLVSMQYEMHLNEKGQTVDSVQRMTPGGHDPAPPGATAARVLPGTRDPLGMMQYLRTVDWTKTSEVRSPVFDGHKLYDVHARLQAKGEAVTVPAGNFNTLKLELRVLDNGVEMKDAHFTLYLTDNDRRTPVLLEALMPFATARVELTQDELVPAP